jgi:maltose alpha-D-glucosyltransferase/alpha-amylase
MGMSDLWYKNAIFYAIDVECYLDSNGDGFGDFKGLIRRLDYLADLGVTCLWLLPFYPSPFRDNGYDVSDHYGVDPRLGSPGEFVEFLREARERGLRVIVDLIANHTSDQHPWFRDARRSPGSIYRDYYIWSEEPVDTGKKPIVFSEDDPEDASVWEFDEEAGAWYYHTFYPFQPDLNIANPDVRAEIREIMGFWLQLGVSGFRIDAAPHMIEEKGTEGPEDPHRVMRTLRRFAASRRGDAVLLAETDVEPEQLRHYFGGGDGDEMNVLFNFQLDNYLFLALAREEAEPLRWALRLLPPRPATGQWANFLRNLDELDLERLSEVERQEVYAAFAPKEEMRIYGRGIRRRLAPMLGGDRRRIELAYSLLFTLPGSPLLVYGDEIGLGDDLSLPERWAVRTPMQWSDAPNAGFSAAPAEKLVRPVVAGGDFAYERVNVEAQRRDPESLLNWLREAMRVRRANPVFGWGDCRLVETGHAAVLAHRSEWEGSVVVAVHNLSSKRAQVELNLPEGEADELVNLLGPDAGRHARLSRGRLELEGYGCRWYRVGPERMQPHCR